jgi:hypothetical protein
LAVYPFFPSGNAKLERRNTMELEKVKNYIKKLEARLESDADTPEVTRDVVRAFLTCR